MNRNEDILYLHTNDNIKIYKNNKMDKIGEKNKKGISLIVLIITILIIIVLAGAVILVITNNNPLENASEAVFKSDMKSFQAEFELQLIEILQNTFNIIDINADSKDEVKKYIPSIAEKN